MADDTEECVCGLLRGSAKHSEEGPPGTGWHPFVPKPTPTPVPAASERTLNLEDLRRVAEAGLRHKPKPVSMSGQELTDLLALVDKQAEELARWEFNSRANMQYAAQNLTDRILKLQAFKDYVHLRLDEAGIPKEPGGEHSKAGCRVGDRLDIALTLSARAEAAERELAMLKTDGHKALDIVEARALREENRAEAAEARAEKARDMALKACRKAMRDCFDEEFESLQEGLMTDADITDKEREGMQWQLKALDVWREDMPDRAGLYAIAALTAPPPTAKDRTDG